MDKYRTKLLLFTVVAVFFYGFAFGLLMGVILGLDVLFIPFVTVFAAAFGLVLYANRVKE